MAESVGKVTYNNEEYDLYFSKTGRYHYIYRYLGNSSERYPVEVTINRPAAPVETEDSE